MQHAREISPAAGTYRGAMTTPERWPTWTPRRGDVLVCTPPKCGTTWTQTMVAMLLAGRAGIPDRIGAISPWVDSRLGEAEATAAALAAQSGRRVVKTHTPADGFPVWEGVSVIAVYRHPLDVFVSLLSHVANRATAGAFHRLRRPLDVTAWVASGSALLDFQGGRYTLRGLQFRSCAGRRKEGIQSP